MTGWTPLYQQIVASSIWGAPDHVRLAWITLLAVANKQGVAAITEGGLARLAVITRENAADALKVLSEPDPDTLTQENQGRRIERVENGWRLLNFQKYRELAKTEAIREANAQAQARWRASQAQKESQHEPNKGRLSPPTLEEVKLAAAKIGLSVHEAEKFHAYYESNGWKVGKNPMKNLSAALSGWKLRNETRNIPESKQIQEEITVKTL